MKKVMLCLILMTNVVSAYANDDNSQDLMYKAQTEYYNHLYSCSKGSFVMPSVEMFGYNIDFKYEVLGKEGNNCLMSEKSGTFILKCKLPMNVAKVYALEGLKMLKESKKNGSASSDVNDSIISNPNYCSF